LSTAPSTPPHRIAILGAPQSGKTWLANQLRSCRPQLQILDDPAPSLPAELTLLMGLDLPASAGQQDASLRHQLQSSGVAYSVVYGQEEERLRNALRLIEPEPAATRRWTWACEACSDPDCEHRLFTGLSRSTAAEPQQL
jgi:hypothetical protein